MLSLIRSSFLIIALLVSSHTFAQTLWTKAEYGMTLEQAKTAFPNATAPATPSRLGNGATALLAVPGIEIAGSPFRANFYFLNEKLVQVTLSLENKRQFESVMPTYLAVEEILRAKYGTEISRDISRGVLKQAGATWLSGATNISVLVMGVGDGDALMNINYQVRISKDAEKL